MATLALEMAISQHSHALRWNAYAQVIGAVGQIAITLILVQLLEPAEFGRVALVYLVSGLVALLDEGGFSTKLITSDERNEALLNIIFYQEVLVGIGFAIVVAVSAPLLATLFEQPDLTAYILALSPVFIITGPRRFYQTLFQRDLAFKAMGIVRIIAVILFIGLTVVLATLGFGVWSLVWGLIARMTVESLGFCSTGFSRFQPKIPSLKTWRTGYGRFGLAKLGERVMSYIVERLDILIIGKALGPDALGVYDVFKRLSIGIYQQVIPMFSRIALPQLARLQSEPEALAAAYLRQVSYICYILFPSYLFQAFFAKPIVLQLFGEQWLVYTPIFVWISLLLLVRGISGPVDALLMARGFVKRELFYSIGLVAVLSATLLYFVSGGLEATVVAVTWLYAGLTIPIYLWVVRPASYVRRTHYFKALSIPLAIATLSCAIPYFLLGGSSSIGAGKLILAALLTGVCHTSMIAAVDSGIRNRLFRRKRQKI